MGLFDLGVPVKDVRKTLKRRGSYRDYGVNSKTHIIIHHSLTKRNLAGSNAESYARYHVGLGWPGIGYHFVIEADGTIKYCHSLGVMSYHVGNHNRYCVGICLSGDFRYEEPTQAQKECLRRLHAYLTGALPNYKKTLGHCELSGYEWKQCPVFDYTATLKEKTKEPNPFDQFKPDELNKAPNGATFSRTLKYTNPMQYGKDVEAVQKIVGTKSDGYFGPKTKSRLINWQKKKGIKQSGEVGDYNWMRMFGKKEVQKPKKRKEYWRVLKDGKQIGYYDIDENARNVILEEAEKAMKKNQENTEFKIERELK
ncbi:N-acetylmuramoyl-L-alanine amidase [Mechercharimyces sp. CAU 1602]|uniref:peptidoglycan recognition protein family protein n=1 Tax=Mechercharimyces sp. CAU 1602 TaxID=2973933 RepID=UPI0021627F77|nr:N-acetylmuramoyl-L-alanine amidase [Mechercharimyces sp. CAU 1602]MCS1350330.1 N-acetylmuramoyl-L-alanine amidase [Mechercharimyces sp. CAU 1602]